MELDPQQTPLTPAWLAIREHVLDTRGEEQMVHELPDGTRFEGSVVDAFDQCRHLDIVGNDNPRLLLTIIEQGIRKAQS